MLLVNHCVKLSPIHGLGLFTRDTIAAGSVVWRFDPLFDVVIPASLLQLFLDDDIEIVRNHAEYIRHLDEFRLGNDGDMFMNHSDTPTLIDYGDEMLARVDISIGSELTCDYNAVKVLAFRPDLSNLPLAAA